MKTILLFLALTVLSCQSEPPKSEPEKPDNPQVIKWGMSKEQVKQITKDCIFVSEDENSLSCKRTMLQYETGLRYLFSKDKLVKRMYKILDTFPDMLDYVRVYTELKEALTDEYGGEPLTNEMDVNNYKYSCGWLLEQERTVLILNPNDGNPMILIIMTSTEYSQEAEGLH